MGGLFESIDFEEMHKFMNNTQDIEFIESYNRKKDIMKKVYLVIFIIYMVIGIFSLGMFYHLRNWYIIKQRNFNLTFTNGISAFFSGAMTLLVQFYENVPCPVNLYTSDVVNPFYNAIFLSRSLRIVLLYHFNIFKVTALKKKSGRFKLKESYIGEKEPNYYLPKIYNKVDKIIYGVILIPTLTAFIITLIIHILNFDKCKFEVFGMSPTEQLKTDNSAHSLFTVAQYSGLIFAGAFLIVLFFLAKVKDSSKYGAKFECISTIILIIVITAFNFMLNSNVQASIGAYNGIKGSLMQKGLRGEILYKTLESIFLKQNYKLPKKIYTIIFDYTKGGRVLFSIISCYMLFSSIILPIIKCYNSKKEKNKYFHEPTSSIQYFYKVLNSPPLIEELKSIAIKEFSVENVLFWENYQILQKMVYRYQIEFKKAERIGNPRLVSQYDFEGYYQQQLQTFSVSSMDEYSYDPNMPVPRELMTYYISFYHTFIDSLGPASVNISGSTIKQIYGEMCSYPTIGMFDNAKNEIVEMMYSSIFPILLRQNRKQMNNITIRY